MCRSRVINDYVFFTICVTLTFDLFPWYISTIQISYPVTSTIRSRFVTIVPRLTTLQCDFGLRYDGRKVTTYTTHQWHVVLEVFCVVYVGKPPTLHCVVGGLPTCCCWFTNNNMLLLVYQHVVGLPTCCCWFTNNNMLLLVYQHVVVGLPTTTCCCWFTNMLLSVYQQQHVVGLPTCCCRFTVGKPTTTCCCW